MIFKERLDLPEPIVRALTTSDTAYTEELNRFFDERSEFSKYRKFGKNFSVTSLAKPPKSIVLERKNAHKIVKDPVDMFYTLFGSIVHETIERGKLPHQLTETRIGKVVKIGGEKILIHGQLDLYDPRTLILEDYKYAAGFSAMEGSSEYEAQLNVLRWLVVNVLKKEVIGIRNVYLIRDFSPKTYGKNPNYPKEPIHVKDIPIWDDLKVKRYIASKVKRHLAALKAKDESEMPKCSSKETWAKPVMYACYKRHAREDRWNKNASKVGDKATVDEYIEENCRDAKGHPVKWHIERRASMPGRCARFCDAAPFCKQFSQLSMEIEESNNQTEDNE